MLAVSLCFGPPLPEGGGRVGTVCRSAGRVRLQPLYGGLEMPTPLAGENGRSVLFHFWGNRLSGLIWILFVKLFCLTPSAVPCALWRSFAGDSAARNRHVVVCVEATLAQVRLCRPAMLAVLVPTVNNSITRSHKWPQVCFTCILTRVFRFEFARTEARTHCFGDANNEGCTSHTESVSRATPHSR